MKTMKFFTLLAFIFCLTMSNNLSAETTVTLGNRVWWDLNDNGKKDSGEPNGGWIRVNLYQDNDENGVADLGFTTLTTVTDGSGFYSFTNLAPGKYFVGVEAGWSHYKSTLNGGDPDNNINNDNNGYTQDLATYNIYTQTISLELGTEPEGAGNINNTLDVGMWKGNGLGDIVWLDNNRNGIQEDGEPGLANVIVKLKNLAGDVLETKTTDASGKYFFYDPAGYYGTINYQIEFVAPSGYLPTYCNTGADDEKDSDALNGIISSVNVPLGQWNHSLDAGFMPESAVLLPVKLLSFSAMLVNNNKVDLKWSTVTEVNLNNFTIERSTDGVSYSDAGMVFANGSGAERMDYGMSDNVSNVQSSVIYYRLRSIDNDGKSQLSETRIIRLSKTNNNNISILTYPNPLTNELRITIPANWQNKKLVYEVIALNGQIIKRQETANSSQTETMNVSNLSSGMYMVRVSCEGQMVQQKIVKH
jgi:SdrD B-like domain/Secretion system C-terminal sorting domain